MILQNIKFRDCGADVCGDLIVDEAKYIISEKGTKAYRDVVHVCLISKAVNRCFIFALRLDIRKRYKLRKLQTRRDIIKYIYDFNNWGLYIESYPINYEISIKDLNIICSGNIKL